MDALEALEAADERAAVVDAIKRWYTGKEPAPLTHEVRDAEEEMRARRRAAAEQLRYYLGPQLSKDPFLGPIACQQKGWVPACWLLLRLEPRPLPT